MFAFNTLNLSIINTNIQILILGSSLARTNINHFVIEDIKSIQKENILNFGFPYGTPFDMYINILKYKNYLKNIKYVFIGLDPFILTEKYYINKIYEKFLLNKKQLEYIKKYHRAYIEKYHPTFWEFDLKKIKNYESPVFNNICNGFEPRVYKEFCCKAERTLRLLFDPVKLFPISRFQIKVLKKIIFLFQNSQIYFFLSPAFNFYNIYEKIYYKFDTELVDILKKELGNIKLIGELKNSCLNKTDYFDDIHLNLKGSNKFTTLILKQEAVDIYDINSFLEIELTCMKSYKCYFWETTNKLMKEIESFIKNKKNVALIGDTNISKLIKFYFKNKNFIVFDDYRYDNKTVFSTNKISNFIIDKVIQTHFGDTFYTTLEFFKISDEFKILHTQLEMYFSIYKKLSREKCF